MDSIWEYRNLLLAGTAVTVQLALASLALSVVLGLVGAAAKLAANPVSQKIAGAYTTLVRGVPDLVLMMLRHLYKLICVKQHLGKKVIMIIVEDGQQLQVVEKQMDVALGFKHLIMILKADLEK